MPWLIRDGTVLAAIDETPAAGSKAFEGARLVGARTFVHTFGSPERVDLAWCARGREPDGADFLVVKRIRNTAAHRVCIPRPAYPFVLMANGGSFERWSLRIGDRLEVRSP